MRIFFKSIILISAISMTSGLDAVGRGGGGRGGGARGGGSPGGNFKPGNSARPAPQPSQPARGSRPNTTPNRPGDGGRRDEINKPVGGNPGSIRNTPSTQPSRPGGRPGAGDIANRIGSSPAGHMPGTPGNRPGYAYRQKSEMRGDIHRRFAYHPIHGYPFGRPWFDRFHWRYNRWPFWAGFATGSTLASWLSWPPYNGYGTSQPIVYYPVEAAPTNVYETNVTQVTQTVSQGQNTTVPNDVEWLNIGAFGLIPISQTTINFAVQLAVTKDGSLRGLYWDLGNDSAKEVVGFIDKDTMRIAWQEKDAPDSLYFETNVDQLTQQESLVNVYDPKNKTLVSWQVIQIEESDLPPKTFMDSEEPAPLL
ncbi:MAG: hypothetical protein HQK54_08525 [Oligoflexales bacterium]|nr:hypothetical protein [Oligoflexales bacterium]